MHYIYFYNLEKKREIIKNFIQIFVGSVFFFWSICTVVSLTYKSRTPLKMINMLRSGFYSNVKCSIGTYRKQVTN